MRQPINVFPECSASKNYYHLQLYAPTVLWTMALSTVFFFGDNTCARCTCMSNQIDVSELFRHLASTSSHRDNDNLRQHFHYSDWIICSYHQLSDSYPITIWYESLLCHGVHCNNSTTIYLEVVPSLDVVTTSLLIVVMIVKDDTLSWFIYHVRLSRDWRAQIECPAKNHFSWSISCLNFLNCFHMALQIAYSICYYYTKMFFY